MDITKKHKAIVAARISLFSMLLLTFGPLIGQLRAPEISPLLMHTMMVMDMSEQALTSPHQYHSSETDHTLTNHSSVMMDHSGMDHSGMDHEAWDEQCGYCSLSHSFPFIQTDVPTISGSSPLALPPISEWVRTALYSDSLFLQALKRAPPNLYS